MRKKDSAWNQIFSKINILQNIQNNGVHEIDSATIKTITHQEPRIICKNDTIADLPEIFKEHKLNILAIRNGKYLIFKDEDYNGFLKLPDYTELTPKILPYAENKFQTLRINERTSEKKAFKFATANNLLFEYFDEKIKLFESVSDRFFCKPFTLNLKNRKIAIKSVQLEIDSLYEDVENKQIYIFELKNTTASTFNIRQLYYPYQHFITSCKTSPITILVQFSGSTYYLTKIIFTDNYYEYKIDETKAYVFDNSIEKKETLDNLLNQNLFYPKNIPTPQANDINKVFDLLKLFDVKKKISKDDVTNFFKFDPRQANYYIDAARYLDLIEKQNDRYFITKIGKIIFNEDSFYNRRVILSKQILKTPLFNDIMRNYKANNTYNSNYIVKRILFYDDKIESEITAKRRSSTVKSWIKFIENVIS